MNTVVVGGGLAGLSAAVRLAERGVRVTVLESRPRLGGRASSFADPSSGQLVDNCQHVSMGCCTAFARFCDTVGIGHFLEPQSSLTFVTPDGRTSRFAADPWPAPFHLGRALASAHYLTAGEKLRIGYGLAAMLRESPDADPPLLDWLLAHRQTPRLVERFWGTVLVSALNETADRVGLKYARKVFRDGFLATHDGWRVFVPSVPLGRFYGDELRSWLANRGVEVRLNAGVKRIQASGGRKPPGLELRSGETLDANAVILAVPFDRILPLLPEDHAGDPFFARIAKLTPSPITSVHFWYDRPPMRLPHAVLLDGLGQWAFSRGESAPGEHYLQVVVSASRQFRGLGHAEVQTRVAEEIARLFPSPAKLLRSRAVTEHAATFSAVPGVDAFRPPQRTPVPGLFLAGDWTATGWPATMEGAVRSGELAAAAVLESATISG